MRTPSSSCAALVACVILVIPAACIAGSPAGVDSYDAATNQLTAPSLQVGTVTFTNVVVDVGTILSGPAGTQPNGSVDTYDPATNQWIANAVQNATGVHYNYTGLPGPLVSIGSVTGADTLAGNQLTMPIVAVDGGSLYTNVVVTIAAVVTIDGGLPSAAQDTYSSASNRLTISALTAGGTVYTNVVVTVGSVLSVEGHAPGVPAQFPYSFRGNLLYGPGTPDGANAISNLILGSDGNYYGTTAASGLPSPAFNNGSGTIFRITPAGTESIVYAFQPYGSGDGAIPSGPVVQGSDGNLYVMTSNGGANGNGAIVRVTPSGSATVLYSLLPCFTSGCAGAPVDGLIQASDGNFYGVLQNGGAYLSGLIIRMTPAGAVTELYSFSGNYYSQSADGGGPAAGLIQGSDGYLYGTTVTGGSYGEYDLYGYRCGTVYRTDLNGFEQILHSFCRQ